MPFGLLGPLDVRDGTGASLEVRGRQPRVVLSMLLAASPRPVTVDSLIDAIWGDAPPASANGTLQTYVSRLRRIVAAIHGTLLDFGALTDLEEDSSSVSIAGPCTFADRAGGGFSQGQRACRKPRAGRAG